MHELQHLFNNNEDWAQKMLDEDADFFKRLQHQQTPEYLWIGCSDSRVPANEIVGLLPGELFVHRNVANMVVHTDFNCLSVMQYAVDVLKVKHIIVCGHYGCGGVMAAMTDQKVGLVDNWLRNIKEVNVKHKDRLSVIGNEQDRGNRLCELNVIEQVLNVCESSVVLGAWERGQELSVHGWIYGLGDGHLRDGQISISNTDMLEATYQKAIQTPFIKLQK